MLLTESFNNNLKPILKESNLTEADKRFHYITNFGFKDGSSLPDDSFDDAQAYLQEDDMTQYIPDELKDKVTFVQWELDDIDAVHVDIYANQELTDEELNKLKEWIEGQNSDGLGEGFEQQSFAEAYWDPSTGDGPYTYSELQDVCSRNYDNMPADDYNDYLDSYEVDEAVETYLEDNEMEDTPENREEAEREIYRYPEDYLDDNTIDNAKQEAARNDYRYNENDPDWGGMVSMSWDVPVPELEGEEEIPEKQEEPVEEVKEEKPEEEPVEEVKSEGPSEEDLKRIEEYRAKGWI